MTATRRCPTFASVPSISTKVALPPAVSRVSDAPARLSSATGERPIWPRHRLTFASAPPTAPGKKLTVTAAVAPELSPMEKLLKSIAPGAFSTQLDGTLHFGE